MALQISTDEFRLAAARLHSLSNDIEHWCWRASGAGALTEVSRVRAAGARLEELASRVELLARAYDDSERSSSRQFEGLARASLSLLAVMMPGVYAQLVLAGVLASNTRTGVALDATLASTVPLTPLVGAALATGVLTQQPVVVSASSTGSCAPAQGFAELLSRIPRSQAQVRIERLSGPGLADEHVIVYIAGTKDFGIVSGREPWDMASNAFALSGVAMADSERAVRDALAQAGVDASAPLILVGHSQGGLIAARLAASGDFNVTDLLTAGAPSHGVSIPDSIRVTTLEHTNDIIPALGSAGAVGVTAGGARASALRIRETYAEGLATTRLPAHVLSGYIETAHRMDSSTDLLVRQRRSQLTDGHHDRPKCTAREYTAVRTAPLTSQK